MRPIRRAVSERLDDFSLRRVTQKSRLRRELIRETPPRWFDFQENAAGVFSEARPLVQAVFPEAQADDLDRYLAELATLQAALDEREQTVTGSHPEFWDVQRGTVAFLYMALRVLKPEVALETGVANGRSTATILAAMNANGTGTLHSVDIDTNVGALVDDKSRWELHVIEPTNKAFGEVAASVGPLDFFMHDGDHSYDHQMFELKEAWPRTRPGGLVMLDDADWCWAAIHFFRSKKHPLYLLEESRKIVGVGRKPPAT